MIRKTLTILSLIGLLLSVGLWGVSYWKATLRSKKICLIVQNGTAVLGLTRDSIYNVQDALAILNSQGIEGRSFAGTVAWCRGFTDWHTEFWAFDYGTDEGLIVMSCPLWLPCFLFGATSLYCLTPIRRRRKRKKLGLCLKCGYDLRASKDRCPECGEKFETT